MPHQSCCQQLLDQIDTTTLHVAQAWVELATADADLSSSGSSMSEDGVIRTPSPPSPMSETSDGSGTSPGGSILIHQEYAHIIGSLSALWDEVQMARILHIPDEPPMWAPQIQLLDHFAIHHPKLFQMKLHVNPDIFNDILDQISNHTIFHNESNNPQLPVAMQLAIFLNCAGHYGNAASNQDVCQWAGISIESVMNHTNCVMTALLDQHDVFIKFPPLNSDDVTHACHYIQSKSYPEWQNGILAVDGSFSIFIKSRVTMENHSIAGNHNTPSIARYFNYLFHTLFSD
jgi:hypothetical protein